MNLIIIVLDSLRRYLKSMQTPLSKMDSAKYRDEKETFVIKLCEKIEEESKNKNKLLNNITEYEKFRDAIHSDMKNEIYSLIDDLKALEEMTEKNKEIEISEINEQIEKIKMENVTRRHLLLEQII